MLKSLLSKAATGGNPLLSPSALKGYATVIIIAVLLGTGYFLYKQHTGMVEKIAVLETVIEARDKTIKEKDQKIAQIKNEVEAKQKLVGKLIEKERLYKKRQDMLEHRLTKDGRDIGVLARKKPGLVERIIDGASDARMRCFEIASGSPLTEEDLNAKNTVCPHLINPDP